MLSEDIYPPWLWASGLLEDCETDVEAFAKVNQITDAMQPMIEAALAEVGRLDLAHWVDKNDSVGKAIAYKASTLVAHTMGVKMAPCLNCYLTNTEHDCPGISPARSIEGIASHGE